MADLDKLRSMLIQMKQDAVAYEDALNGPSLCDILTQIESELQDSKLLFRDRATLLDLSERLHISVPALMGLSFRELLSRLHRNKLVFSVREDFDESQGVR